MFNLYEPCELYNVQLSQKDLCQNLCFILCVSVNKRKVDDAQQSFSKSKISVICSDMYYLYMYSSTSQVWCRDSSCLALTFVWIWKLYCVYWGNTCTNECECELSPFPKCNMCFVRSAVSLTNIWLQMVEIISIFMCPSVSPSLPPSLPVSRQHCVSGDDVWSLFLGRPVRQSGP